MYINDDLTTLRNKFVMELKKDDNIKQVWTIEGRIFCIQMDQGREVKRVVDSPEDLFKVGWSEQRVAEMGVSLSSSFFPFIRGEVLPATFSPPHLLFFSTLLCLLSSSSSLPPLLSSSHLSLHSPPISVLASLVSSCPALVTLPLSSVVGHRPSFLRVQPTVICS